jgi:hypothetical protein
MQGHDHYAEAERLAVVAAEATGPAAKAQWATLSQMHGLLAIAAAVRDAVAPPPQAPEPLSTTRPRAPRKPPEPELPPNREPEDGMVDF